jgi:hypothetical protein
MANVIGRQRILLIQLSFEGAMMPCRVFPTTKLGVGVSEEKPVAARASEMAGKQWSQPPVMQATKTAGFGTREADLSSR